jgi:hypothetical protein
LAPKDSKSAVFNFLKQIASRLTLLLVVHFAAYGPACQHLIDKVKVKRYNNYMLMDRLGLLIPAHEDAARELDFKAVTPDEFSLELETARAMGCVILRGQSKRLLSAETQHIAIYPQTGGLTMWREGLVEVEPDPEGKDDSLTPTMHTFATIRINGLEYGGVYRREGRLPLLRMPQHHYSLAEDIRRGDQVSLSDPEGNRYKSHVIANVDRPES